MLFSISSLNEINEWMGLCDLGGAQRVWPPGASWRRLGGEDFPPSVEILLGNFGGDDDWGLDLGLSISYQAYRKYFCVRPASQHAPAMHVHGANRLPS